jgi:hypothetical protein
MTSCDKEDKDLTIRIVGEYTGGFGNNIVGDINPYTVVVEKISDTKISVKPKTGNEFAELEFDLVQFSSAAIVSPTDNNQQIEKSVIFTLGSTITLALTIDPTGIAHSFVGEQQ